MWTKNAFAYCDDKLREPASKRLGYWLLLVIAASLGCDGNNTAERKRPPEIGASVSEVERTSEIAVEPPKQENTMTSTVSLKIRISGFANSNGSCRVAVYLGQAHFNDPEYAIAKESIRVLDSKATWQVELPIPAGTEQDNESLPRLAVSAYHDENENSRLDKNSFGIPTERYGFSKNPKRAFGPPKFSEAAMTLDSTEYVSKSNIILDVPILIK